MSKLVRFRNPWHDPDRPGSQSHSEVAACPSNRDGVVAGIIGVGYKMW